MLALLFALLASSLATLLPAATQKGRGSWEQQQRLSPSAEVEVTFALKQSNIPTLLQLVNTVSDPSSPKYGNYLSLDEVTQLVSPPSQSISTISTWIKSIGAHRIDFTANRDFVVFLITSEKLEQALNIKLFNFVHKGSQRRVVRTTDPIHLPQEISKHIDLVLGLTDFFDYNSERTKIKDLNNQKFKEVADMVPNPAPEIMRGVKGSEAELTASVKVYCPDGTPAKSLPACSPSASLVILKLTYAKGESKEIYVPVNSDHCSVSSGAVICLLHSETYPYQKVNLSAQVVFSDGTSSPWGSYGTTFSPAPWITPQFVYDMYGIPQGLRSQHPNNSQSVVAFEEQYISLTDLKMFFADAGLPYQTPTIVGKNDPTNPGGESTLDIQWVMAIGSGVPTTFWSVSGPGPTHGNGAYVLTWAIQISNTTNPPLVTSISYGDTEQGFFEKFGNYDYITRMNIELAKMATRGLTVLAGSGDAGATNVGEDGNDISDTDPTCTPMRPFFPSNSPYVVSVSSTFPSINALPFCQMQFEDSPVVCSQVGEVSTSVRQGTHWTTGGGFSNLTLAQPWQKSAINQFLDLSQGSLPPNQYWNSSGRGYPDVSTIGFNLFVVWGGQIVPIGGTSASGPILAGIISLLNDIRLVNGLPPLGLVTPLLYKLQGAEGKYFRDVVVGENNDGDLQDRGSMYPTYCPYGFKTQVGWDAVTGLGTPHFAFLAEAVKKI